jgi:hypothetical protein
MTKCMTTVIGTLLSTVAASGVLACDPNESCNRCLASAFGHCITQGNDPICEARKAACRNLPPPVVNMPGSPFGQGGPFQQGGPGGLTVPQIQQCIANISGCAPQIVARLGYESVRPIVDNYIRFLQGQAGTVLSFDESFISSIQQFYPIDLHNIRYAVNINTIHGANITIGNMIFFVGNIDLTDVDDKALVYHELEHAVQYVNRGGVEPFLAEYILKSGGSILHGGNSIDMHDNIDLEHDAIQKASYVSSQVDGQQSSQGTDGAQGGLACHGIGVSMVPAGWQGCMPGYNFVQVCTGQPNPNYPQFGQWSTTNQPCQ